MGSVAGSWMITLVHTNERFRIVCFFVARDEMFINRRFNVFKMFFDAVRAGV